MEKIFTTDVDIRKWLPGKHTEQIQIRLPQDLQSGEYDLQIGIGGNGRPSVYFASDAKLDGEYFVLTKTELI